MPPPANSPRDYRIFVGAFPTGELGDEIQRLRQQVDPKTAAITAPHVTLAGTYWRSGEPTPENEAATVSSLQAATAQLLPFDLHLGGIRTFPPRSKPVIFLDVMPSESLGALRRSLLQVLGPDGHRSFSPHLTLAMRLPAAAAQTVLTELQNSQWSAGQWTVPVHAVWLMQRGPLDPAWRPVARLPLGAGE